MLGCYIAMTYRKEQALQKGQEPTEQSCACHASEVFMLTWSMGREMATVSQNTSGPGRPPLGRHANISASVSPSITMRSHGHGLSACWSEYSSRPWTVSCLLCRPPYCMRALSSSSVSTMSKVLGSFSSCGCCGAAAVNSASNCADHCQLSANRMVAPGAKSRPHVASASRRAAGSSAASIVYLCSRVMFAISICHVGSRSPSSERVSCDCTQQTEQYTQNPIGRCTDEKSNNKVGEGIPGWRSVIPRKCAQLSGRAKKVAPSGACTSCVDLVCMRGM